MKPTLAYTDPYHLTHLGADVQQLQAELMALRQRVQVQAQKIHHLRQQVQTDSLTGLANARAFQTQLQQALALLRRHGYPAVLAVFDLDRFKQINDTFGHLAGDQVLRHVAQVWQQQLRQTDVLARLGGDEFGLILRAVTPAQATYKIQSLLQVLADSPVLLFGQPRVIHASAGWVPLDGEASRASLLAAADAQMYQHKRQRQQQTHLPLGLMTP